MFSLSILLPESPAFVLHPPAPQPPLDGLRLLEQRPGRTEDEVIECAQIGLRGPALPEWLEALQAALSAVRRTPFALLERRPGPGDPPLYTALRDGWLEAEPLNQSLTRAAYTLRLYLRRARFWRTAAAALPLTNANGSCLPTGLTFYNHQDAHPAHQNYAEIAAADLRGGLPAPLSLRLLQPAGQTLQQVIVAAGSRLNWGGEAFAHALEGEQAAPAADCTASALISDSSASGAAYRRVQWTRPDSAALLRWTLSPTLLGFGGGRLFRPVLRLASLPPAGLYLRWRLLDQAGRPLEESPAVILQPQQYLQTGAAVNLPPRWLPQISPAALLLELRAESRDSALKTLDVDFLHMLPAEQGWLHLQALNGAAQAELWLDGENQLVYSRTPGGETGFTYTLSGGPLTLQPGSDHRLYLLWETAAGMPIDSQLEVQAFYAARVNLP